MRIDLKDIASIFEQMQGQLNINYVSIVIFTAMDVDSLCTLKILTKLFKTQNIQYQVYPVGSYSELAAKVQQSKSYEKIRLFAFINCGGVLDLSDFWFVQKGEAQIFLFDSNKPTHHTNIENEKIKIVDDGSGQFYNCPTSEEINKYDELEQYDLQEEQKERDQEEGDLEISPKRKNKKIYREKLRKHKEIIQKKITDYYGKHFFGSPSSYYAYRLIKQLRKCNNDYLWWAIIGMTSMYLEQRLSRDAMQSIHLQYQFEATRMNPKSIKKQRGQISVNRGYQMVLLQHWSLYQSMVNSPYLIVKLRLWQDRGISTLKQIIHQLGISLQEAKQLYKYMPTSTINKMQQQIFVVAEKHNLKDLVYQSFIRQVDYTASYSASDYSNILNTLLEASPSIALPPNQLSGHRIRSFWQAYDLLQGSLKQINSAIQQCKKISQLITTEARNLIERDGLIALNSISIATIHNDSQQKRLFQHPSALIKLAYLLMGIVRQKTKNRQMNVFFANWVDMAKQNALMVGVITEGKSGIGNKFNTIAQQMGIQIIHDNFTANIIQLKKDHLIPFIKKISTS